MSAEPLDEIRPKVFDLTLATANHCDTAAKAWRAYITARNLFGAQSPGGPVSKAEFDHLHAHIAGYYGWAINLFEQCDDALRRELANEGYATSPADDESIERVLFVWQSLGMEETFLSMLLQNIAGVDRIEHADCHGVEWLLRFFAGLGVDGRSSEAFASRFDATDPIEVEQIERLQELWREWSGAPAAKLDATLNAWLSEHYGVSAPRFLRAAGGQKAINDLRGLCLQLAASRAGQPIGFA